MPKDRQEQQEREAARARMTALVVDRDATSRRFAELALGRVGFAVETARDAAAAFAILEIEHVDLIVCDTDLDDMDGLTFFRRLADEQRLSAIPFLFLSADRAVAAKVTALRAGADDYLFKPCDVSEFVARAEALVKKQRRVREAMCARAFSFAGELSVVPFVDVVALLEMTRRTGVLSIVTPDISGQLMFERGGVVHAHCGSLVGEEAVFRLFRETEGHFEFALDARPAEVRTIQGSATALILEAARVTDTANHAPSVRSADLAVRDDDDRAPRRAPQRSLLWPSLEPDPAVADRLELAIRDKFALGDLSLWSAESLARWTKNEAGRDRFHVHLVADLPAGVSALLALGGAPSARWVLESLSDARKAFGVTFHLRRDRVLDVVLIDAADPTAHLASLCRKPSLMLVCPPDGSLLSLGSSARAGLVHAIDTLSPRAVLGVGGEALSRALAETTAVKEGPSAMSSTPGSLGQGGRDLRALLIDGIRFWSRAARPADQTV